VARGRGRADAPRRLRRALVAGLWVAALSAGWSPGWAVGASLAFVGVVGLAGGIRFELEY
jgi:hypothetical protein